MTTLFYYLVVLLIITEAEECNFNTNHHYNEHNMNSVFACSLTFAAAACEDEIPSSVCDPSLSD